MKLTGPLTILITLLALSACIKDETALEILSKTIESIDTIETIYYKQDMLRTNPRQVTDTIFRYREMYFERLPGDSLVGVKGHWYMYIDDKVQVIFEDIYDGNRLIRKNNRDSILNVYDFEKYPAFKESHFWGHNTLYGMQYSFKYILDNKDYYIIQRLSDTTLMDKKCFQVLILLENKMSMPGFSTKLEDNEGKVSKTIYIIDKQTYYPLNVKGENFSTKDPKQVYFMDQTYYDIQFNIEIDHPIQFNTSDEVFSGYEIIERKP